MLVLSRRPSQKILFPSVGISIEIIQTKGRTVRVGVAAPKHIRVLRDELAGAQDIDDRVRVDEATEDFSEPSQIQVTTGNAATVDVAQIPYIDQSINEICLAIALAQNQNRQELQENVSFALEQAMERLESLRETLIEDARVGTVCESRVGYVTNRAETTLLLSMETAKDAFVGGRAFQLDFEMVA